MSWGLAVFQAGNLANRVTAQLGGSTTDSVQKTYKTGLYKVNIGDLNIRKGPGTNYGTNGMITDGGTYTITEIQNGYWGRLKLVQDGSAFMKLLLYL